jgi:hypothetical protein
MRPLLKRIERHFPEELVAHVKHHWLSVAFVLGFVMDNLTLNNVEQLFDVLILLAYIIISMVSLFAIYAAMAGRLPERLAHYARQYAPFLIQYAYGGLLSGMLIFYGRSGAWTQSWPYLLIIIGGVAGNELLKDRTGRFLYNITIFFIGLFSYVVLMIPVFTGYMGAWVFVGSGVLALVIMIGFIRILQFVIPNFLTLHMKALIFTIGSIFAVFNFLYFANLIPPIPLSLKDVGIYHSVVRFEDGTYQLTYEDGRWWQFTKRSDTVFHPTQTDTIYCFASVFTPTRLHTEIYHSWEYYDTAQKKWVEYARLSYPIAGGRNNGYRGYTLIEHYQDGKWRCSVETARGQVLGRETFTVDSTESPGALTTRNE